MFNDEFKELCLKHHLIGGRIVVADDLEVKENCCFGLKDIDKNLEIEDDTIFRIASISKTVLAIGLMQLWEKGLVGLDEDISTYLGYFVRNPYYPNDKITLRMITTQTSSILDGYDDENPKYDNIIKGYNGVNMNSSINVSLKELLTKSSSEYFTMKTFGKYKPGTRWNYSNFGCGIMACIIEKVSGEYYVDYMENHVFKPLGITASYKSKRLPDYDKIATMYSRGRNGLNSYTKDGFVNSRLEVQELGDNYRGPAGGLFISMPDLAKIMQVFLNYGELNGVKILEKATVEYMYQQHWCGSPDDSYRAKGIQMKVLNDHEGYPLRGHTGGAYGVRSYMFFDLAQKIGACFITNGIDSDDDYNDCQNMFKESIDLWLSKYGLPIERKIVITQDKIELNERKILDDKLLIGKFIKAMCFADALNTVGIYNEDEMTFTLKANGIEHKFEDVLIYFDKCYINLEKALEVFNLEYDATDDALTITLK